MSPFPFALTAIEVMRPRYHVFFVPFGPVEREAGKEERRAVGRAFLDAMAAALGSSDRGAEGART